MNDNEKTKEQLVKELQQLRQQVTELEAVEDERKRAEEALRESERRLRLLVKHSTDAFFLHDLDGRILDVNQHACESLGYTREELLGLSIQDVEQEFVSEEHLAKWKQMVPGVPITLEGAQKRKDGTIFPVEVRLGVFESGERQLMLGLVRDITERKQAEAERERLLTALEHRSTQLQTAAEVSHAASSILDPNELIQRAVELIQERFDLYYAGLFLVDEIDEGPVLSEAEGTDGSERWAVLRAGTGKAGRTQLEQGHKLEVGGESMIGWCVANAQARIALDVGEDAVHFRNPFLPHTRSEMALPLISRGRVIGAMTIQSTQEAAFSDEDISVLQTMADQLANAIENARLFEKTQAALEEASIFRQFAEASGQGIGIATLEGEFTYVNPTLCRILGEARPEDTFGKTFASYYPPEMQQRLRDEVLPTVMRRGQWVGESALTSTTGETILTIENLFLIRDEEGNPRYLADVITDITERKRIESLLEERVKELGCLNDIGRKIDQAPPIPEFLQWVTDRIPPSMQYPDVCVVAIEFEGQVYGVAEAVELPCQIAQGLRIGNELVGRVYIAYEEERDFLNEESTLMGNIVRRVSGYIENRRLFEQTQAALAEVEAIHRRYLRQEWQDYLRQRDSLRQSGFLYDQTHAEVPQDMTATPDDAAELVAGLWRPEMERAIAEGDLAVAESDGAAGPAGSGDEAKRTGLAIPIIVRGQTIGVLGVEDPDGARYWSEQDRDLMRAIGQQLGLALENARLLEETQRRAAREQVTGKVTARMRETLDVETILKTVAQEVRQAMGLPEVVVRLAPQPTGQAGDGAEQSGV